jgi:hypothetical protein
MKKLVSIFALAVLLSALPAVSQLPAISQQPQQPSFMGIKFGVRVDESLPKCHHGAVGECWEEKIAGWSLFYNIKNGPAWSGHIFVDVTSVSKVVTRIQADFPASNVSEIKEAITTKFGPPVIDSSEATKWETGEFSILLEPHTKDDPSTGLVSAFKEDPIKAGPKVTSSDF